MADEDTDEDNMVMTSGRTAGRRGRPPWAATVGRWPLMTVVLAVAWSRLLLLTVSDANEAVLSNNTYKGEQKSDLSVPIGQSALLPCELDERSILECGIVHSVKWYRGSSRIFLWSAAVPVAQPRKGYHERTSWSYMPNDTIAYLVLDNITAIDEATYKCEITYTAVNEFCNIVQFINLTTYIDPDYISVGVLPADENDDVTVKDEDSDYEDDVQIRKKFTKVTSGNVVGPIDEDNTVRFYCESGRGRPLPQVTWWWNGSPMSAGTDYQYKRFSDGLMMARNVLSLKPVKRGMGGRYECRVRTATVGSPILNSYMDLTINVRPLSVQIISDSGGSESHTVTSVAGGATSDLSDPNSAAYVVEGEGLVVKCIARGARPQANVTWYYYQKDYYDDDDELQDPWRTMYYKGERKIDQHKKPVALFSGQSVSSDDSMTTPPAPVMGTVQIAQHTEYQIDGTRDTHSQLEMAALHRRQDGSILRCDAYNSIGEEKPGTAQQPLTVNMTIRVKYLPTVWLTRPSKIVVNETQTVFMRCEYTANPMNPVTIKWFRDGEEVNVEDRDRAGGRRVLSNAMKYIRINDTVLLIEHAHRSASGEYRCSVRNSVGPANSTNTIRLTVNYAPRVKLDVSIDDQEDSDPDGDDDNAKTNDKSKKHKTDDEKKKALHPYRPAILETDHVNITMRCIVDPDDGGVVVDGEGVKADGTYDSSLNLTTVHWYWNGKQLKLPNCSQLVGHDSETEDENNGGGGISKFYYDPNNVAPGDYDEEMMMVMRSSQDDDTGDGSKRQSRMMCNDRELVLIDVSKNMHGNYSCRARNSAGLLTRMSEQRLLDVYFAPGPVTLEFSPRRVIKGRNVTLKCNTQYLGRPDFPTNYSWYRDGHQIMMNNHNSYNVNTNGSPATAEWFVDHVSLETRANFTCAAYNLGGLTMSEPVYIEVYAPPNYILGPPQYKGVAFNDTHVNASCTVECYPLCTVEWLRQGVPIDPINNVADRLKYMIITEYMQAERLKNDFEAVRSTLVWRLENWTNGQTGRTGLDPATDSAMYSCRSSGNSVGEGVPESIMHFSVEYPPANMSVSKSVVHVNEGNIPEKVFCNADAHPGPSFEWYFQKQESSNNLANVSSQQQSAPQQSGSSQMVRLNTVNSNNWLVLNSAVTRQQAGNYMCVAHNAHGAATITTYLDVMYKPSCQMRLLKVSDPEAEPIINTVLKNNPRNEDEEPVVETDDPDRRILVCTVTSNPGQVQFTWSTLRRDNQSDTDSPSTFPVTEETIVTWGEPVAGQTEADGLSSAATNVSVVILDDNSDGPRTYVCNVVNNVGSDMCSMIVQAYRKSDVPWWKQLLVMIGLGGVGIIQSGWIVVVALAILILIVLAVLILLFYLLCRRCRRRDDWPGNHQHDEEPGTGASSQNGSNGPKNFYENLPFHGMRPALNQFSNTTVTPLTTTTTADAHQKSKPPLPVVSPLLIHRPKGNGYVSLLRQAVASLDDKGDGGAKRFSSLQRPVRNKTGSQQFRSLRVKSNNVAGPAGEALATDPNNNDGDRDQNKQATGGSIFGPVPAPRGRKRLGQETYENLLQINDQKLCCRSLETISYHLERLKFRGNSHGVWFKQQQQPQEPITEQPKLQQQEQLYYDPYDSPIITHHRPLAPAAYQSIEMTRVSVRREQPELQMYSQRRLQPEDGVSTLNSKYYHPGSIQPPQNDDSDGPIAVHSSSSSSSKRRRQSHSTGGYGRSNTIGGRAMAAAEDDEPHQYNNTRRRRGVRMVVDGGGGGGGDGYKTGYDRRRASATAAANNNGNNYVTLGHRGQNSYAGPSTTGTAGARHKRQPPKRSLSSSYYHPGGSATWRRTRGYADDDDDSDSDDCGGRFNRFTTPVEVSVIGHGPGGATYQTPAAADPMSSVKFNRDVGREIDV
ncbi:uncharacterized protein LOC126841559 isoform X6 [Adelges cooleyi]|uniref:uncharacterized protein LOC126841559 isoform X6 n=1 Tax=Adelges cooleyi TaxID=133065 RepID=UPI0021804267|nr:uncharacterized protein LOC126841559 isoform X6 [Adelges cooleyi]